MIVGDYFAGFAFLVFIFLSIYIMKTFKVNLTYETIPNQKTDSSGAMKSSKHMLIITTALLLFILFTTPYVVPPEKAFELIRCTGSKCIEMHGVSYWIMSSSFSLFIAALAYFYYVKFKTLKKENKISTRIITKKDS